MKVSVALIVYNGANYMQTQLNSILSQSHKVDEIIVVEDASTDNTKEILSSYANQNPALFSISYNSENMGSYKSIEKAIKLCTGDIILLADQDDYWELNKVATIIKWFQTNPTMNGVFTNGYLMDAQDEINTKYTLWDSMSFPHTIVNTTNNLKLYINTVENAVTGAAMAFRNNLPFLKTLFPKIKYLIHDRWLAINLAENNALGILDEKLIRYRIHSGQAIGGKTENVWKYINRNKQLFNDDMEVKTFEDLKFILNKIEINLFIQKEIRKVDYKGFDNDIYISVLENKHSNFINIGFKKWPLLSILRKIKKGSRLVAFV
jgi:glycosyltransferase involved in cell wall biosynthesis